MENPKSSFPWEPCLIVFWLWMARHSAVSAEDGLLTNGDFEIAPGPGFLNGTVIRGAEALPGWKIQGTVEYINQGGRQGYMVLVVPEGMHAVRLGNDAQISQDMELDKGSLYSLTFSSARTCAQFESLNISVPPVAGSVDLQTLYNSEGWDAYAWGFRAYSGKSRLIFLNPGLDEDPTCGPLIDSVAVKEISAPQSLKYDLIVNGDFEEGPWMFGNVSVGVLLPPNADEGASPLPGWIVESSKAVRYIDSAHYSVPHGKRAVQLISGKEGTVSQMIQTVAGKAYILRFLVGEAGDSCKGPLALTAFAGDRSEDFNLGPAVGKSYEPFNITFKANSDRTRIAFFSLYYNTRAVDNSSLCGPVIDRVRVMDLSIFNVGFPSRLVCGVNLLAVVFTLFFLKIFGR